MDPYPVLAEHKALDGPGVCRLPQACETQLHLWPKSTNNNPLSLHAFSVMVTVCMYVCMYKPNPASPIKLYQNCDSRVTLQAWLPRRQYTAPRTIWENAAQVYHTPSTLALWVYDDPSHHHGRSSSTLRRLPQQTH